jgi:glycosyltransferase involved in cell wall biosynthesis
VLQIVASVTAVLLCYNCEPFVTAALRSVLSQDFTEPMEIVVSDDRSTDGTFEAVQNELSRYAGASNVKIRQRQINSGSKSAHLNDVFPLTTGDILISFDADDISEGARVRKLVERFRAEPAVQAVYSSYSVIDRQGVFLGPGRVPRPGRCSNTSHWFARADAYAAGATLAIRRAVVDQFGPLEPDVHEDIVLPFRASLLGEVAFIDEPLVRARRHADSLTADMGRFASIEEYRARMLEGIERARRNAGCRLRDIRRAEVLMPGRSAEFKSLERIVAESTTVAASTAGLVSRSAGTRIAALLRLAMTGAYRDELLQHAALALVPDIYLRYKRHALGVDR